MIFEKKPLLNWSFNDEGVAIFFESRKSFDKASHGVGPLSGIEAYTKFESLLESGEAAAESNQGGIFLPAGDVVRLDVATRMCFGLPPVWPGYLLLVTHSVPNLADFSAKVRLVGVAGHQIDAWSLRGGILKVGDEYHLPDPEIYACLSAYLKWKNLPNRCEADHLRLLHVLTDAARRGCRVDASGGGKVNIVPTQEIGIDARDQPDGTILLTPVPMAEGLLNIFGKGFDEKADPQVVLDRYVSKIAERLSQLDSNSEESILRIGSTIVLLDKAQSTQARIVARERTVPASERDSFRKDPSRWLADHPFLHGDVHFLPRVIGIGEWTGGYLGAGGELGEKIDWLDKKPETEKSRPPEESDGRDNEDPSGKPQVDEELRGSDQQVPLIEKNDEELRWGLRVDGEPPADVVSITPDYSVYPRQPFTHQLEAIQWLGRHAERCGKPEQWTEGQQYWGAGALLADDMGLGKTLSTLVFLREWSVAWMKKLGTPPPAFLIVSPLSLVDNWGEEIEKTFGKELLPFARVSRAIPDGELRDFYATASGHDIVRPATMDGNGEVESYGLRFGDGTNQSLDMPGTIVLTTYTTLRDHRFSFAGCNWSAVVFDEAQNIKNPNALQTIAAKALKGFFRIALSGTPVENHLGDLWSLMDTVEPGALGSFSDFRKTWIHPIRSDPSKIHEVGKALREYLDALILRRTKEESIEGLPKKHLLPITIPMSERQTELYDAVLHCASDASSLDDPLGKTNQWLASMWELRRVSLHPDLLGDAAGMHASSAASSRDYLSESGKLNWLISQLDAIRGAGEKVLIFAIQKKFQELLRQHLSMIYGLKIPIINGDTKAISTRRPNETRLGLLKQFSDQKGFGICILSPIAAGAGLNITAANHVIHLERHWNPAKEDQATDRAYRIGQTREVHVYFPLLEHPHRRITTFDTGLNRLIEQKKQLAGSLGLIPIQSVGMDELVHDVLGGSARGDVEGPDIISLREATRLSWDLFEALIACIYEPDAERVILTPKGRDHGADVLVIGHGLHGNFLVQVKTTGSARLDSEEAIRELEGAAPFYENAVGIKFPKRFLHTNANAFSRRTRRAAALYRTELHGSDAIEEALNTRAITITQVIARNAHRQSIAGG